MGASQIPSEHITAKDGSLGPSMDSKSASVLEYSGKYRPNTSTIGVEALGIFLSLDVVGDF